jgi:hypothetical protein
VLLEAMSFPLGLVTSLATPGAGDR